MDGWIKIHRSFIDWEWYSEAKMVQLFIHVLLKANYSDNKWRGIEIKRGQFITSFSALAGETGQSVQNIRTGIKKLIMSQNLTIKSTNKYTVITVCNYGTYQSISEPANNLTNKPLTNNQQTTNKQLTTTKKVKKVNNEKKDKNTKEFETFWNAYDKKVDRKKCEIKWYLLTNDQRCAILSSVAAYVKANAEVRYRKNPYTYLNGECWNDEIKKSTLQLLMEKYPEDATS